MEFYVASFTESGLEEILFLICIVRVVVVVFFW